MFISLVYDLRYTKTWTFNNRNEEQLQFYSLQKQKTLSILLRIIV